MQTLDPNDYLFWKTLKLSVNFSYHEAQDRLLLDFSRASSKALITGDSLKSCGVWILNSKAVCSLFIIVTVPLAVCKYF